MLSMTLSNGSQVDDDDERRRKEGNCQETKGTKQMISYRINATWVFVVTYKGHKAERCGVPFLCIDLLCVAEETDDVGNCRCE